MFTRLSLQSSTVVRSAIGSVRHASISVILLEKVGTVGQAGSVVNVKRGYARNFLIPRKMAGKFRAYPLLLSVILSQQ